MAHEKRRSIFVCYDLSTVRLSVVVVGFFFLYDKAGLLIILVLLVRNL